MEAVMLLVTIICWYVKPFNINKYLGRGEQLTISKGLGLLTHHMCGYMCV